MKNLGILFLVVIGCSAQGADWTNKETKIIAKKLWSIASKPGRAIRQYLRAHPGYPVNRNLAFQIKPSPQKVKQFSVDKSSLKTSKMVHFGEFLKTCSLRSNSVTRQVSFKRTKISGKYQNSKIQMRHFELFSNNVK